MKRSPAGPTHGELNRANARKSGQESFGNTPQSRQLSGSFQAHALDNCSSAGRGRATAGAATLSRVGVLRTSVLLKKTEKGAAAISWPAIIGPRMKKAENRLGCTNVNEEDY